MKSYILIICGLLFLVLGLLFTYTFTKTMKYDFFDSKSYVIRFDNEIDIDKIKHLIQLLHKSSEIKQFGPKNQIIIKMVCLTDTINEEKLRQAFYDHLHPFFLNEITYNDFNSSPYGIILSEQCTAVYGEKERTKALILLISLYCLSIISLILFIRLKFKS